MSPTDFETRRDKALAAMRQALGTPAGDGSVSLFIDHHLDELPPEWWRQRLGVARPEPAAVLALLQCRSSWGENDLQVFDFTLPDDVTNYLVSVRFDVGGQVESLSMES